MPGIRKAVVMLGAPGSGKTTVAGALASRGGVDTLNTDTILEAELEVRSELGGAPAPVELVEDVMARKLRTLSAGTVIFDDFPRSKGEILPFFHLIEKGEWGLAAVLVMRIPRLLAVKRLTGRRVCPVDGAVYNTFLNPPPDDLLCELCGTRLVQLDDDSEENVRRRIRAFERFSVPVVKYFRTYYGGSTFDIPADQPLERTIKLCATIIRETQLATEAEPELV